jgi:hypothetical protein
LSTPRPESMRLYGPHAAAIATIMGSLIAGIVLAWINYRALGRPDLARRVGWIGIVVQILLLVIFSSLPPSQLVMFGLPLLQTAIAYWGMVYLQGKTIDWHLQAGATLHSSWRAAGMGLAVGFAVFFAAVVVIGVLVSTGFITPPQPAVSPVTPTIIAP